MTTLSTHVLDMANGEPVGGLGVHLSRRGETGWELLVDTVTDADGRCSFGEVVAGRHRLGFETGGHGNELYPYVHVVIEIDDDRPHYHIPLLLSPFGFTTYRGS